MKNKLAIVLKHQWIFLFGSLLFALPFLLGAPFVKTVDNVDYFTIDKNEDLEFYDHLKEVFGNDEFFVIAFKKPDIFIAQNLELLQQITRKIETLEEVREVKSLANIDDTIGDEFFFEVRPFLETIPETPEEMLSLKERALANPLYVNNMISEDGTTAALVVFTFKKDDDEHYRKNLMEKCEAILQSFTDTEGQKTRFRIAGWTVTNLYLSQYLKNDMAVFIPLTYILITLCVYFMFRNVRLTFIALANISVCVGSTMGMFYYLGIRLNNVTTIVPPLIMALALCDTVHVFAHMEKKVLRRLVHKKDALLHVLQTVFTPCLLTTLTTAIGFLSLCISDIPPIREFAVVAASGMVFELLFSFVFLPPLILLFPAEKVFIEYNKQKWVPHVLSFIHGSTRKYAKPIAIIAGTVVVGSVWFGSQIKVETNLLEFFKESSPVRVSLTWVEKELSGISTVDVSIRSDEMDAFKVPENVRVIENIQNYLKRRSGVDVVNSYVDFIKDIHQSFNNENEAFYAIPDSGPLISQYMLLYDSEDINDFINSDFNHARISARTHVYNSGDQRRLIEMLKQYISTIDNRGLEIRVSGRAVSDVVVIDSLVKGQIMSLSLAAGIIFIVMFFVLKSFKAGCLSIIPNLFPITLNFGIMGLFNIPLNTATSLISVVALGIAVDDTIHFLYEYKKQRDLGRNINDSLDRVMIRKGRAIISSSCILCIGFGVMIFSKFIPIVSFGVLSAVIMITAVVGDLVVLPAVLYLITGVGQSRRN